MTPLDTLIGAIVPSEERIFGRYDTLLTAHKDAAEWTAERIRSRIKVVGYLDDAGIMWETHSEACANSVRDHEPTPCFVMKA